MLGLIAGTGAAVALDPSSAAAAAIRSTAPGQGRSSTPLPGDWDAFAHFVRQRGESGQFSGTVLVSVAGQRIVEQAHGRAVREDEIANDLDTRFNLASASKMFTGVAVAQLVGAGELGFDDTIGRHLTGFPDDVADGVTVHHLLTHSSGMGDFMRPGEPYPPAARAARTASDLLPLITAAPLEFEPGGSVRYSNSGYVVAGAIIESVTGHSYYDAVRSTVLRPSGMSRTNWLIPGDDDENTARGYMLVDDNGRPVPPPPPGQPMPSGTLVDSSDVVPWGNPSGGAFSTVGDMVRFSAALLGHHLLSPELTAMVLAGKVRGERGDRIGYGFMELTINGFRIVGHGGGAPGVAAAVDIYPDLDTLIVILANVDGVLPPIQEESRTIITTAA